MWIKCHGCPQQLHGDICKRSVAELPSPGELDGYVVGFPCKPWSDQNSSKSAKGWKHPAAKVLLAMLTACMSMQPAWMVWENVVGIYKYWTSVLKLLKSRGVTRDYCMVVLPLDPQRVFGTPMARPRLYMVAIRKDLCVGDAKQMADICVSVLQSVLGRSRKQTWEDWVPPKTARLCFGSCFRYVLECSHVCFPRVNPARAVLVRPCYDRSISHMQECGHEKEDHHNNGEPRWKKQHADFRQRHGLPSRSPILPAAGQGLTQRQSDMVLLKHAVHRGPWPLAVDISQSVGWGSSCARACPCLTTSSKIAIVYADASFHMLTDKQAMNFMGLGGLSIPKECSSSMTDLLGNGMHVDCVGLAVGLAVSLVSAQPIPQERRLAASSTSVLFLKWQQAKDRYTVALDARQARKQKKNLTGKATGKRSATKKVPQNQQTRSRQNEARGKSSTKPRASLPIKRPAASLGSSWERLYS